MEKFYLLGKISLLKSWFHVHSENDQKMQNSDGEMDNTFVLVATRGVVPYKICQILTK